MNLLEVEYEQRDGSARCRVGDAELPVPDDVLASRPALMAYAGRRIALGIRPELIAEAGPAPSPTKPAVPGLRGEVVLTESLGSEVLVHIDVAARPVVREEALEALTDLDEARVEDLKIGAERQHTTIIARLAAGSRPHVGTTVELSVATRGLHFFDLDTGLAITNATPET